MSNQEKGSSKFKLKITVMTGDCRDKPVDIIVTEDGANVAEDKLPVIETKIPDWTCECPVPNETVEQLQRLAWRAIKRQPYTEDNDSPS